MFVILHPNNNIHHIYMKKTIHRIAVLAAALLAVGCASQVDFTRSYVPEEGGINFMKVTDETQENLSTPNVERSTGRMTWWVNPLFAINNDGTSLAYNTFKNGKRNIFVRSLDVRAASTQRTFRTLVNDVCFSADGQSLCFSEIVGNYSRLCLTDAYQGTVVQQVSPVNTRDYGPHFSVDGKRIFFTRADGTGYSIWSYEIATGSFSNYCFGLNPIPINNEEFLCTRMNSDRNYEIWRINYVKGSESLVVSQEGRSFSTASLSPDGQWIVCVSNTPSTDQPGSRENLDIYVVQPDGSRLTQLTYHLGDDCSPVWSPDGKYIYFLSQRGTEKGEFNIWRMNFNL